MKKFAVTSSNFYRTSQEAPNNIYQKESGSGSLQARQQQQQSQNPALNYYKQYGINLNGQAAVQASGSRDPRDSNSSMNIQSNQIRTGPKNAASTFQNPHNVYANNTAYGYRDQNRQSSMNNNHQKGTIFGSGGVDPARNAYND